MTSQVSVIQGGDEGADVETFDESAVIFDKGEPKISAGMRYANGEASQGTFLITDDSAGRDEWAKVRGNCAFTWTEDASGCPIWLSRGRIKQVAYGRGVQRAGFAIEATATVDDANADLRQLPFTEDWVRPEETDTERIYALQPYILNGFDSTSPNIRGTTDITITDSHLAPDTNTITMPAKTYPIGTMPQEVIDDCASTAGKVYGVVIHHGPAADSGAVTMGWSDIPTGSSSPPHWVFAGTLQKSVTVAGSSGVPVVEDTFAQNSASGADPVTGLAVGAGLTDRAFVVAFANYDRDGAASSVTWKPTGASTPESFTRIGTPIVLAGTSDGIYPSGIRLDLWYLLNPTASDGTSSVLEAFFATGHPSATGVWLLSGVDQSSPVSYAADTTSSGTTTISTDVGGTGLALDAIGYRELWNGPANAVADVGQTEDFAIGDNNGFGNMAVALQGSHKEVAGSDECSHLCLLYIQETDNTTFATTVKISDDHDDVDPDASPPVYYPVWDQGPAANADSENLLSAMLSRYGSGDKTIYLEDATRITRNDYAAEVYNDDRSVNVTQATARATGILGYRGLTHYTRQVSVIVRPEQTDLICAGMSIQIKASAGAVDPGPYETVRIAELKWEPAYDDTVGFFYWAHMNLDRTPRNSPPSQGGVQPMATSDAEGAKYDNTVSGLAAGNVQDAVDEIASFLDGGTTGDVLTKLSATDYDMDWAAPGTGGGLPWFNVMDPAYGAANDNTTDDTAAINAAIADLNTATRGVLYFPAGAGYKVTSSLTSITASCIIRGDGAASFDYTQVLSSIRFTSGSTVLFTVGGKYTRFEHIGLLSDSGGTPSAGSGIHATSAYLEQRCDFEDVHVRGFYDCIDVQVGAQWVMHASIITAPVHYGLRIRNTVNNDAGDWSISDCNFYADAYNATSAIRIESSGGGKIVNTKINKALSGNLFVTGIDLAFTGTTQTVILLVSNCSIENVSGFAISGTTATGSSHFYFVTIVGNQVGLYGNNTGKAISLVAADATDIAHVSIADNVFYTDGTARSAIQLTKTDNVTLVGNVLSGNFTSLYTGTSDTNTTVISGAASFATPAVVLGTAAAGGAASTVIRSDSTIAAFDATAPGTSAVGDSAATGSVAFASRRDHAHGREGFGSPVSVGVANADGTATTLARSDHVHADIAGGTGTDDHIHYVGEALTGDGATTVFLLANEAYADTVAAYNVAGARVAVTLGGMNDQITFGTQPGTGTFYVDYIPVLEA
jgi:hypothetical protein